ncbi:MAG TPA: GGDEF domain-containing protein [Terriglobia bacterium]|nr:GGDEF domain-containing protein [Terriglobia bacterium]
MKHTKNEERLRSWHGRLQAELLRLESRTRLSGWVSGLAAAFLLAGAASLLLHPQFWRQDALRFQVPPSVLFVTLSLVVLAVLYFVRRELEIRKLTLVALDARMTAESERSAGMIDAVTHVFNRRFLHGLVQGEIARAERNRRPLTLAMCDLDHFKEVNDRYGHLVGDEVLAETANILKSCVRGSDYVVRYGGDEFLLVLSETDEAGGRAVLARVREKIAEWDRRRELGISLSLGLYVHQPGQSAEKDIAEVDAQLYAEKHPAREVAEPH